MQIVRAMTSRRRRRIIVPVGLLATVGSLSENRDVDLLACGREPQIER
jgi:hypothetical protein